jgi:hypothetical protein
VYIDGEHEDLLSKLKEEDMQTDIYGDEEDGKDEMSSSLTSFAPTHLRHRHVAEDKHVRDAQ